MQDRIGENRHINLDPVIGNANPLEVNSEWAAKLRANSVFPTAVSSTVIAALVLASCVPAVEHASNPDEVNGGNENPERVEINDENAVAIFRDFDSFQYSGREWSRAEGEPIELSRNRDDSLTRAHPVIKGEVRTGLDIVKGHTKQQAKEDGNGIITQERSFLAVESKDGKIYGYILLFDRDESVINDDKATLKYRLGVLEEDGETLAEVQGGWYIEDIEKNEDGTTKLKKVRLEDPDLDLNVEIVEEVKQEGQPTPEATAPASFGYKGNFDEVIKVITGADEAQAAEPPPELPDEEEPEAVDNQPADIPTPKIEIPISVASYLGYTQLECGNCIITEAIPDMHGVRKELWSDETGVMAYWTKNAGWVSTKNWKEVINSQIYQGRGFEMDVIQKSAGSPEYFLQGVLDGTFIEEPFNLYDSAGNVIMINKLAYPVYYIDKDSRLNSILNIQLAEVNGEFTILNGTGHEGGILTEYGITEPDEISNFFKNLIKKGQSISEVLRRNEQIPEGNIWEWDEDILKAWNSYQNSYSVNYGNFLDTGTGVETLFSRGEDLDYYFEEKIIGLP